MAAKKPTRAELLTLLRDTARRLDQQSQGVARLGRHTHNILGSTLLVDKLMSLSTSLQLSAERIRHQLGDKA